MKDWSIYKHKQNRQQQKQKNKTNTARTYTVNNAKVSWKLKNKDSVQSERLQKAVSKVMYFRRVSMSM